MGEALKNYKIIIFVWILFLSTISIYSQYSSSLKESALITSSSGTSAKTGGICFRTDDNINSEYFYELAEIFDNYNSLYNTDFHLSLALNLGSSEFDTVTYQDSIIGLQQMGHEIMDHTPNHRTNYFTTKFDTNSYLSAGEPIDGVDHLVGEKVCLEFSAVDTLNSVRNGICSIKGDSVTGSFSSFDYFDDIYLYFPSLDTLVFINNFYENKTLIIIEDLWEDEINLGVHNDIKYFNLTRSQANLTTEAIKVLGNETIKLANLYGMQAPTAWVQPGGRHPVFAKEELKAALGGDLNYVCGASFEDEQSLKVFNEYDPNDDKKFGIQWEDFNEDFTSQSLDDLKTQISNNIAKHKVRVGHNHFYTLGTTGFETRADYNEKVDSLLSWCRVNDILVKTYSEWANILYNQTPDPYEDIFPPLNVNLDNFTDSLNTDGVPDGYYERTHSSHGVLETEVGAPSTGDYCFSIGSWNSRIFLIQELGGIEKGENEFKIWTKGGTNDEIEVIVSFPENSISSITYEFPADTPDWTEYDLSQSLNSNKDLIIDDSVSVITIEVKSTSNFSGTIKVSGMYLAKKIPTISADIKILLEGTYDTTGVMSSNDTLLSVIPTTQPFTGSPWSYSGDESVSSFPNDIVDWVLVELRSDTSSASISARKAGFVKTDGSIINTDGTEISFEIEEGEYYVVIYHRNHLSAMSASKVNFQ